MPLDDAIRKRGFRRWYERQLYESHTYLLVGLLSLIMMAIAIEEMDLDRGAAGMLKELGIAVAGAGLCVYTWREFTRRLFLAEYLGEHATCAACRTYARFEILRARRAPNAPAGCALDVRCRGCGHAWTIE